MNEETIQLMLARLTKAFAPSQLEIIDDSDAHIGHSGAAEGGGHFILTIQAEKFNDVSLIKRHQLIYEVLGDLIPKKIHALSIKVIL